MALVKERCSRLEKRTSDRIQLKPIKRTKWWRGDREPSFPNKSDFSAEFWRGKYPTQPLPHTFRNGTKLKINKTLEESVSGDLNGDTPTAIGPRVVPHYCTDYGRTPASAISA
jgi:hypothetical protein